MASQIKQAYQLVINGKVFETAKESLTGKQILKLSGYEPSGDFMVYLLLEGGDMESIRSTEAVDLDRKGIEEFLVFKTDVVYRLEVNGQPREWGAPFITGKQILKLAGLDDKDVGVWQQIKGEDDRLIEPHERVDLTEAGIERFRTGAKYSICIEGKTYEWPKKTITAAEIATLGGWPVSEGVVEIEEDQSEHTLEPDEIVKLTPGKNFCKRQRFKRGFTDPRVEQEYLLLKKHYPDVQYKESGDLHWFMIDGYVLPGPLSPSQIKIAFSVGRAHPLPQPYGFYVQDVIKHGETIIPLTDAPSQPPFEGQWRFVSWSPEKWQPGNEVHTGDNLWAWARSFRVRLMEGV